MLQIGELVDGKYKILYQIGKGGMSKVYLAINELANKQWAIKEVRRTGKETDEIIYENWVNETNVLKNLRHPNIPSIVDVIDKGETYLIVMDFIEGDTLKTVLDKKGRQKQEDVVRWAIQLCDVLTYLHTLDPPIIYRDMKPANVMLKPDGNVMLIDFGIAREYKETSEEDTRPLGTRGYAAPEQYGGQGQSDQRTDIYNLGATIYHLVTGMNPSKPPYEMRPITEWQEDLSTGLEAIILKCTKNDPDERYQTAEELKHDLLRYTELEESYLEERKSLWKKFTIACLLSVFFFISSIVLGAVSGRLTNGTYEQLLRQAKMGLTKEERVGLYTDAIHTSPGVETAYIDLLTQEYLEDDDFSRDEADYMTKLLGYIKEGDVRTAESILEKNRKGYDELSYRLGLAYFYYYEKTGNKQLSLVWFENCLESETLLPEQVERAKRFYRIANYYAQLGSVDKAGDNKFSYADYWEDLKRISAGNIVEEDNAQTALVIYKEMTYQIYTHASDFKKAGVQEEVMRTELDRIEKQLLDITDESLEASRKEVEGNISAARTAVDRLSQQEEEEES